MDAMRSELRLATNTYASEESKLQRSTTTKTLKARKQQFGLLPEVVSVVYTAMLNFAIWRFKMGSTSNCTRHTHTLLTVHA